MWGFSPIRLQASYERCSFTWKPRREQACPPSILFSSQNHINVNKQQHNVSITIMYPSLAWRPGLLRFHLTITYMPQVRLMHGTNKPGCVLRDSRSNSNVCGDARDKQARLCAQRQQGMVYQLDWDPTCC